MTLAMVINNTVYKCYTANGFVVTEPPTDVVVVTDARTGAKQSVG